MDELCNFHAPQRGRGAPWRNALWRLRRARPGTTASFAQSVSSEDDDSSGCCSSGLRFRAGAPGGTSIRGSRGGDHAPSSATALSAVAPPTGEGNSGDKGNSGDTARPSPLRGEPEREEREESSEAEAGASTRSGSEGGGGDCILADQDSGLPAWPQKNSNFLNLWDAKSGTMDVSVDRDYDGEGVRCVFRMEGRSKRTTRTFDSMQSALNIAVFIAGQAGVLEADRLRPWLELRGFQVDSIEAAQDREGAAARLAAAGPFTLRQGPPPEPGPAEPRVEEVAEVTGDSGGNAETKNVQ